MRRRMRRSIRMGGVEVCVASYKMIISAHASASASASTSTRRAQSQVQVQADADADEGVK